MDCSTTGAADTVAAGAAAVVELVEAAALLLESSSPLLQATAKTSTPISNAIPMNPNLRVL